MNRSYYRYIVIGTMGIFIGLFVFLAIAHTVLPLPHDLIAYALLFSCPLIYGSAAKGLLKGIEKYDNKIPMRANVRFIIIVSSLIVSTLIILVYYVLCLLFESTQFVEIMLANVVSMILLVYLIVILRMSHLVEK